MKISVAASVIAILVLTILSAGCIGDQTTDITLGNQSIGKITITPVYENMFSNTSIQDKFNVKIELFGMVFSKDGVTKAEADDIAAGILNPEGALNMSFVNDSGLTMPEINDESPNLTAFMDNIFNMPLTNRDKNKTINNIDWDGAFTRMQESMNRTSSLLGLSDT
ncbi:hypothetical protein [Methanorbis furvi]|uniref:Uncharacterized protein n=1 Tax=Methanorbis furvi TaxID=3028299 RepID=A0AAE4MC64_9EURY|nr:hypothetical protein [Methanocorpusculaceae archaeon Ag1]